MTYRRGRVKRYAFWSAEKYEEAIRLRREGMTLTDISRSIGVPVSTLSRWCRGGKPWDSKLRLYFKPKPEEYRALSYLLGLLDSDAYLTYDKANRNYYIGLDTAVDEEMLIERLRKVLKYLLKRENKWHTINSTGKMLRYVIGSRGLYEYLKNLTREEKRRIIEMNRYTMRMYVLGFVDGDGNRQKKSVRIVNSSREKIEYIVSLLRELGISIDESRIGVQRQKGKKIIIRGKMYIGRKDLCYVLVPLSEFKRKIGLSIKLAK